MGLEDKAWELIGAVPGLALGALIAYWAFRALNRRDDVIERIATEHTKAYLANQKVLEKNSVVIGECSAELRESRNSRQRSPA